MRRIEIFCGVAIAASLLFGGATRKGSFSDDIVQLTCLPLLTVVLGEIGSLWTRRKWIAICLGAILAVPLFQLIPLPPALWSALPGRAMALESYQSAGLEFPWLGISISPWATVRVAFSLLPPIAIFLGVLACRIDERQRLLLLVLAIGLASILLDIEQIVEGPKSASRSYSSTHVTTAVGFFANRNHNAAFLYSLMPLAALVFERSRWPRAGYAAAALLSFLMAVALGLLMTGSRAALALGLLSFVLTSALIAHGRFVRSQRGGPFTYIAVGGVAVAMVLLAPSFGLLHILDRLREQDIASDARWTIARVSFDAMTSLFPFGSGLGTFERVYPRFEQTSAVLPALVNHAHNDQLELVLEAGLPGALAVAGWLTLLIVYAVRAARDQDLSAKKERFAALVVLALLFAHSLLDYPLRTSALSAIFAISCAIACAPMGSAIRRERERPERFESALVR